MLRQSQGMKRKAFRYTSAFHWSASPLCSQPIKVVHSTKRVEQGGVDLSCRSNNNLGLSAAGLLMTKAETLDGRFWFGRRKFAGHDGVGKAGSFVRAVTEGLVRGMAAAAERYGSAACKAKSCSLRIHDFKIALDANRAVAVHRDLGCRHFLSPS